MSEQERRTSARVAVSIPARYRPEGVADARERNGTIDNISRNGLLLVAGETFPEETRLRIAFDDKQGGRHELVAAVVRSQAMGGFGVAFVHIPDATLEYVRAALGVE
ncbi:hypothetical protein WPS_06370 [Vulcanimicrobium alpinum]|uniref:PilZ domain-containing protein n=1 Tax=Vulcanimicrobium alpinum TaxID=3016050 RepID=A0AAN1XVS7_UNVUL|nr:PilZ domain-containing protein [Vulcanimicrobium alpinum]BDE05361.1 hypothetical protein WPS_06370 [Vulcanimicrobium alpinum]